MSGEIDDDVQMFDGVNGASNTIKDSMTDQTFGNQTLESRRMLYNKSNVRPLTSEDYLLQDRRKRSLKKKTK